MMCITTASSQSRSVFDNYHKLSLQFGVSRYIGSKTSNIPETLNYEFREYTAPMFGLNYDVFQLDKFNFKTGITALLVRNYIEYGIKNEDIPSVDEDRLFYLEGTGSWRISTPLTTEYLIGTGKNKFTMNTSFIIGYSQEFGDTISEYGIKNDNEEEFTTAESIYKRHTAPWYFNVQAGVGMYFPFEKWMLRANVYYNFALQDLYNGEFQFSNLAQSPDTSGNFSFRGDSFGVEFSIYLKKKKKN